MAMATKAAWLKVDGGRVAQALEEAEAGLDRAEGEVALDFSNVRRIDAAALRAMESFAAIADDKGVAVVLRGVDIAIYKVLKLVNLGSRFSFAS